MQAIILAAGMGRRLGELTRDNTKCMVEVNGVKLIDRMLNQLVPLNLDRVVIVIGYEGKKLRDYIGNRYDGLLKIEYVDNPHFEHTNNIYSLWLAKDRLMADDTLLLESDLIFEDSLLNMLVDDPYPNLALVAKYESWMDGTMVTIDEDGNITNFIPKSAFHYEDKAEYYKTVNIYKFSAKFSREMYVPFLEAYSKAMGNNEYYEQVLRILTFLDRTGLKALPIGNSRWYEIDDIADLDIASTIFAPDVDKLAKFAGRFGGYWRFPGMLDYCYLVNPYFPTPQMRDEMRANFDILLSEYPSGMKVNSLLAAKYFGVRPEYSVVGNGAAELIKCLMEKHTDGAVGFVYPTFEEYPNRLPEDKRIVYKPTNDDFRYSANELMAFFDDKPISSLLIVNPDNPTGNFIPVADVLRLAEWSAKKGIRLIVDESFVDFSVGSVNNSLLHNDILEENPGMVVMKSISKSYGVPGLRLGVMMSADTELIAAMKKELAIWNINSFAEFYMQIFSKYEAAYRHACDLFISEREKFRKELEEVEYLRVIPSQANYFLCEVKPPMTSTELTRLLLEKHDILIKDCSNKKGFDGRNFIRLAVRNRADNARLAAALHSTFGHKQ